ncbi:hypothetical protein ZWY2020_044979 [Hordeum vulgare]|nr:hypothetical protein ZWY2020_044979 [Hordeum vulgare]
MGSTRQGGGDGSGVAAPGVDSTGPATRISSPRSSPSRSSSPSVRAHHRPFLSHRCALIIAINGSRRMMRRVLRGVITFIFAIVGLFLGAVTGGLIGLATESGLFRGTGIGAITGALVSIEVIDSSIHLWRSRRSGIWSILRHAPYAAVVGASTPFSAVVEDEKVRGGARGPGR